MNISAQNDKIIEAYSIDGRPLHRTLLKPGLKQKFEENLRVARQTYESNPEDVDAIIWLGRRMGYLMRCNEAIDIYSKGLELHPDNYKLLRHRGHRHLSIRKFNAALADFTAAARLIQGVPDEIEPDGMPNAAGTPVSTNHFNIWYHLGLTQYLMGDYPAALDSYASCLDFCPNDDSIIALANWQYNTLLKMGRNDDAMAVLDPITEHMTVVDDPGYYHLLLHYRGLREERDILDLEGGGNLESVTIAYGIANRYFCNGDRETAVRTFQRILACEIWSAFGYIAAEADLYRMKN
ncbi:MAG: hypothetical protein HKM93_11520 [Desulfobacteraceae bacterium]|nr:hypothetical protein [Desulfobacteraceae bacterium]